MNLVPVLADTVLPVFILAGLGWVAGTFLHIQVRDPSRLTIYILTPGLILNAILTVRIVASEVGKIFGFGLALTGLMILVTYLVVRLLGWKMSEQKAAMLSTGFMNSSNYGLPVLLLAFGQAGFDRGAIFVILQSLLIYSVAVYIAASGRMNWHQAALAVFKMPLIWAVVVGLAVRLSGLPVPAFIMRPIGMLANGAVVVVVLLLGMQTATIRLKGGARFKIGLVTVLRLIVSPVIALGLVALLRPEPVTAKALVMDAAMPASVQSSLLAMEFNTEPDQVSGAILMTTLVSLVTVSFWVGYLH